MKYQSKAEVLLPVCTFNFVVSTDLASAARSREINDDTVFGG